MVLPTITSRQLQEPSAGRARAQRRGQVRPAREAIAERFTLQQSCAPTPIRVTPPSAPRILLAGSDAAQALMIRRTLEIDGCEVLPCPTGLLAAQALLDVSPDVVLINAPLHEGSATALLRWTRARETTADVTCLVIVPSGESHTVASLYDAGADLVITRPTELDLLSRRISAAISRRPVELAS